MHITIQNKIGKLATCMIADTTASIVAADLALINWNAKGSGSRMPHVYCCNALKHLSIICISERG